MDLTVYIYIYIYICVCDICVYIYIYVCVIYVYIYVLYIYIYIYIGHAQGVALRLICKNLIATDILNLITEASVWIQPLNDLR